MDLLKSADNPIQLPELFFEDRNAITVAVKEKALLLKDSIKALDAFMQQHTAAVCPHCMKVCCINRHGYYDSEDLIYIFSLGLRPPVYKEGIEDASPCQFISRQGCTIERALRPFRCNWYFCSELISHMEGGAARPYREFIRQFQKTVEARKAMLDEFLGLRGHKGN